MPPNVAFHESLVAVLSLCTTMSESCGLPFTTMHLCGLPTRQAHECAETQLFHPGSSQSSREDGKMDLSLETKDYLAVHHLSVSFKI